MPSRGSMDMQSDIAMSDLLESLVPEIYDRLTRSLNLGALLSIRTTSHAWQQRVQKAEAAWKCCCLARFGDCCGSSGHDLGSRQGASEDHGCWIDIYKRAVEAQRDSISTWCNSSLCLEDTFIFTSYVRSWASDDSLLVAGLYNGQLQALDWNQGTVGRPFQGRHGDEVTCLDLSSEYILSGSGDPGYYQRPPNDASVKLWRRSDGQQLGSLVHHQDSVRGIILFPESGALSGFGLTAGLDSMVNLMSLTPFKQVSILKLCGPCRSLRTVVPRWRSLSGFEIRVLASSGDFVAEISIRASASLSIPVLENLRSIRVMEDVWHGTQYVSGISCYVSSWVWEQTPTAAEYPISLLEADGVTVAGGTVNGMLWAFSGTSPLQVSRANFVEQARCASEVVSLECLDGHHFLAMSRIGALIFAHRSSADGELQVNWMVDGFRMYVSTIRCREPLLLVSDGFDNAIRTVRAAKRY